MVCVVDDFLGQASVQMEELRRMPSSRQIVPLTGRPRATTSTSGSVTVEVSQLTACYSAFFNHNYRKILVATATISVQKF